MDLTAASFWARGWATSHQQSTCWTVAALEALAISDAGKCSPLPMVGGHSFVCSLEEEDDPARSDTEPP
jgi:hypothetical protein